MDSDKTENTMIELTTNAETNAKTVKPAPKKHAPKKQPVVVETNAKTTDVDNTEEKKPAPKKSLEQIRLDKKRMEYFAGRGI
jgi:hypothetical protein